MRTRTFQGVGPTGPLTTSARKSVRRWSGGGQEYSWLLPPPPIEPELRSRLINHLIECDGCPIDIDHRAVLRLFDIAETARTALDALEDFPDAASPRFQRQLGAWLERREAILNRANLPCSCEPPHSNYEGHVITHGPQ